MFNAREINWLRHELRDTFKIGDLWPVELKEYNDADLDKKTRGRPCQNR